MTNQRNRLLRTVLDELFADPATPAGNNARRDAQLPPVNLFEAEYYYLIELAAPGLSKGDFVLTFDEDDNLVVSADRQPAQADAARREHYLVREFSFGKFRRTFVLPDDVDRAAITARAENGVLTVTLPKLRQQPGRPRTIAVE